MNRIGLLVVTFATFIASAPLPTGAQGGPTPKAESAPSAQNPMAQMDEHMKQMQAMHDKMMKATTPGERQKLMDEHRKSMQGSMAMMNHMMQGGGMMGGQGGGMMGGKSDMPADKGMGGDPGARMQMMEKRMDMMQMMMQMMMDEQGMMGRPVPAAPPAK